MPHDVFISYSNVDGEAARTIYDRLQARQIRCWMAPGDILGGMTWEAAIMAAIKDCRVMVLVFSAHSNTSADVLKEVRIAVRLGRPVIPVRVEDVPASDVLEYHIAGWQWVDAFKPPLDQHIDRLATSIRALLPAPPAEPIPVPEPTPSVEPTRPVVAEANVLPRVERDAERELLDTPVAPAKQSTARSPSRRTLVMSGVAAVLLLATAVGWLMSRPSPESMVVARIGADTLYTQRLGELLGNAKIELPMTRESAAMIADLWIGYQQLGYAAAHDDSLIDRRFVDLSTVIAEAALESELATTWKKVGVDPKQLRVIQANDPSLGPSTRTEGREYAAGRIVAGVLHRMLSGGEKLAPVPADLRKMFEQKYPVVANQSAIDHAVEVAQRIRKEGK